MADMIDPSSVKNLIRDACRYGRAVVTGLLLLGASPLLAGDAVQAQETNRSGAVNLEETVRAVVGLRTEVPDTARTASTLGVRREGSGIVIDESGLVLTIGYLMMEASLVEITNSQGEFVTAEPVAYDYNSGFGLVRATVPLGLAPIALGDSSSVSAGDGALIISYMGPEYMLPAEVVDVREFPGYWEYLLPDAIFTTPPFRGFGGAALIDTEGALVGVGSLIVRDARRGEDSLPGNMFVPVNALKRIIDDLVARGNSAAERRPWLGVYTEMHRGHLFIERVADDSPAQLVLKLNDIILAVNGAEVADMAGFLKALWASGPPGEEIEITVLRDGTRMDLPIITGDRYEWLRLEPGSGYSAML